MAAWAHHRAFMRRHGDLCSPQQTPGVSGPSHGVVPSCEWSSAPALPEVQTSPPHTHTHLAATARRRPGLQLPGVPSSPLPLSSSTATVVPRPPTGWPRSCSRYWMGACVGSLMAQTCGRC